MKEEELPEGWELVQIGEITVAKVDQVNKVGPLVYVDISSVNNQAKRITEPKKLAAGGKIPSRARQLLKSNDVLVSMTRPNLNAVALVPSELEGAIGSTGFDVLRSIEVEPKWLFNTVKSNHFVEALSSIVQGALYPAVRPSDIRDYEVPLPPLNEQRRIVAKIEALQERSRRAREALAEVKPLLEQFRQSLLAAAFRGDLTADWREQNPDVEPASELLARIRTERRKKWQEAELAKMAAAGRKPRDERWKQKLFSPIPINDDFPLGELPPSWQWISFDQVTATALYGPRFGAIEYDPSGIPTVRTTDMDFYGNIRLSDAPCVLIEDRQREHFLLKQDDLLITRTGATIGKAALFDAEIGDAIASAYLIRYRLVNETVLPRYVFYFLLSPFGQAQLIGGAQAVAQPNVNTKTIAAIGVPLAPIDEQRQIVDALNEALVGVDALSDLCDTTHIDLNELDQSVLAKAFRGKLVPQNPNDEPASVLFDRIREVRAQQNEKTKDKGTKATRSPKRNTAMTKSRFDEDVKGQPYLAKLMLTSTGKPMLTAEELFQIAQLPLPDFYKQLDFEVKQQMLVEREGRLEPANAT